MNPQDPKNSVDNPRPNSLGTVGATSNPNTQLYGEQPLKVQRTKRPRKSRFKRFRSSRLGGLFGTVQLIGGAILLALVINTFIFQSYQVVGESMSPTLSDGDRLIVNKIGKTWASIFSSDHTPKRQEIIVFDSPISGNRQLVKRVIGIPGDTVAVSKGVITIFNDEFPQGFNADEGLAHTLALDVNYSLTTTVPEGMLFVSGDNRIGGASLDSRNDLGLVPLDNVVGELVIRLLPLSESRFF